MFQKNIKKILYVLIVIIVIIITYLTVSYLKEHQKTDSGNDDNNVSNEIIYEEPRYGFRYTVPENLTYEYYDQYFFKITSKDGWYALATIETMLINDHKPAKEMYDEYILKSNPEEEKVYMGEYSNIDIVVFQQLNKKEVDYYFVTTWGYCYYIRVFYETDEFSFENLNDVMYSLLTPDYDLDDN